MGEKKDVFAGLGWEIESISLGNPHVSFNPSLKYDKRAGNQCNDDYELTPFSQFTQTWRWRMQKEQRQYTKNKKRQANVHEKMSQGAYIVTQMMWLN
jgi:tRNA(Leu) C34 or U34 (ribose-2'-O)-methylase TrmL